MCALLPTRDRIAGWLADRQHGVVSREQLLAGGWTPRMVAHAIKTGRLRPVYRGVYAVGHTALRRHGWWQAALLTCGDGSALAARSAGLIWGLGTWPVLPVEVVVQDDRGRKQKRLLPHRAHLGPGETVKLDGLRVTTPARTIVDLAATLPPRALRDVVERAQDLRRFHPDEIKAAARGRRGTRDLMQLVTVMQEQEDGTRSHLERLFLAVVRKARLPRPKVNEPIAGKQRDFVWPAQRIVAEVDGHRYHSSKAAIRRDHQRDRELTADGWRPIRFTFEEVVFEPGAAATELRRLLAYAGSVSPE